MELEEVDELVPVDGLQMADEASVCVGKLFLEVFALRQEEVADFVEELDLVRLVGASLDWSAALTGVLLDLFGLRGLHYVVEHHHELLQVDLAPGFVLELGLELQVVVLGYRRDDSLDRLLEGVPRRGVVWAAVELVEELERVFELAPVEEVSEADEDPAAPVAVGVLRVAFSRSELLERLAEVELFEERLEGFPELPDGHAALGRRSVQVQDRVDLRGLQRGPDRGAEDRVEPALRDVLVLPLALLVHVSEEGVPPSHDLVVEPLEEAVDCLEASLYVGHSRDELLVAVVVLVDLELLYDVEQQVLVAREVSVDLAQAVAEVFESHDSSFVEVSGLEVPGDVFFSELGQVPHDPDQLFGSIRCH